MDTLLHVLPRALDQGQQSDGEIRTIPVGESHCDQTVRFKSGCAGLEGFAYAGEVPQSENCQTGNLSLA